MKYLCQNIHAKKNSNKIVWTFQKYNDIYKDWKNIQFWINMNVSIHIEICIESKDCHDFHRLYSTEMNPCRCSDVRFPLLHWMPWTPMKFMNSLCPDTQNTCFSPTHTTQTTKPSFHTSSISSSIISASSAVMYIEAWSMMTKKEAPVKIRSHIKILIQPTKFKKKKRKRKRLFNTDLWPRTQQIQLQPTRREEMNTTRPQHTVGLN